VSLGVALVVTVSALAQSGRSPVLSRLVWFDRSGNRLGAIGPVADHGNLEISPDGARVAVAVTDPARSTRDIWLYDVKSGERTQLTSEPADENWLIWSPDGAKVLLNSFARGRLALVEAPSSGSPRTELLEGEEGKWPVSWSPDGRYVLYVTNSERTSNDIWVLLRDGSGSPYPYLRTAASENWASFSPDGKFVVFSATTESGQAEVYVSPWPAPSRRWRISADGGAQARWRRDGKEIFYVAPNNMLVAASVDVSPKEVVVTNYDPLFELQHPYGAYHAFDVTPDGQRFLVNTLVVDPSQRRLIAGNIPR
jgi:dipeptidyl aminopeptidase/acylaminoacyl peptidase